MPPGVDRIYAPGNELTGLDVIKNNCNATEIDFSGNRISNVTRADFACKQKLISLSLSDNLISELAPDTFDDLPQLTSIQLSNIGLISVSPDLFASNHLLSSLDLRIILENF